MFVRIILCAVLSVGGCVGCLSAETGVEFRETLLGSVEGKDVYSYKGGWVRYMTYPGPRPFAGPQQVVVSTEPTFDGRVKLRLREMKARKVHEFSAPWQKETTFLTGLSPETVFEFQDLVFIAKDRDLKKEEFRIESVDGVMRTTLAAACRFDVVTENPLHIARDESERPVLTLTNPTETNCVWRGYFHLSDLARHRLEIPFDVRVSPGATVRFPLDWPLPGRGYWKACAEISGSDGSQSRQLKSFAVLDRHDVTPRLPSGKFRMGINYHYQRTSPADRRLTLAAMVASGAKLARTDFATWASVQPSPDRPYDWSQIDRGVSDYEANGFDMDAICWNVPQWAARPERRQAKNWREWARGMPEHPENAAAFFRALAARYGERIAYYEIGNEWELGGFLASPDEAIAIQKLCYTALKEGNPAVKVISNGWAYWDSGRTTIAPEKKGFPERMMTEAKGFYDAHPIHYHSPFPRYRKSILTRFLARRKEMGIDDVPWYSNESALTGVHGNEVNVAETVWKKILFAWAYGSRDYIWYNLRATGWNPEDPEMNYGLVTADYYPRPSYAAFSALTALLSGFDFDRIVVSDEKREVFVFSGERDGERQMVLAGWDSGRGDEVALSVKTDAACAWQVDFMGNRRLLPVEKGTCRWTWGRVPSALLLQKATFVTPDPAEIGKSAAADVRSVRVGVGAAASRPADLTVNAVSSVQGFFDADPMMVHRTWKGPRDVSFRVWYGRSKGAFAMRVCVTDDVHHQAASQVRRMSEGDCVRVSAEVAGKDRRWELGFRRTDDGRSESCIWEGDRQAEARIGFVSRREGDETVYDISIPLDVLGVTEEDLVRGMLSIAVQVDDSDGEGRDLWMGQEEPVRIVFPEKR